MRKTVYTKLLEAQKLLPKGMHFCIYEAYRSLELQKMLFDTQYESTKKRHPDWSLAELFNETTKLVSPVSNQDGSINIPPHSTGGAFDVYLIDDKGHAVDMGIHPKDWMQDKDGTLSLTESKVISDEAKKNRAIMNKALEALGFVNYPTEFWHWSYGDRYWAFMTQAPFAIYGSSSPF
jgi:D-alanyl-D-alanine dipeptidase